MARKQDTRQSINRELLEQLTLRSSFVQQVPGGKDANTTELDNLLKSINSELTAPTRLRLSPLVSKRILVDPAVIINPETTKNRVPMPIDLATGDKISDYSEGGSIVIGATLADPIVVTGGTGLDNLWQDNPPTLAGFGSLGVFIDGSGQISLTSSRTYTEDATQLPFPVIKPGTSFVGFIKIAYDENGVIAPTLDSDIFQIDNPSQNSARALQVQDRGSALINGGVWAWDNGGRNEVQRLEFSLIPTDGEFTLSYLSQGVSAVISYLDDVVAVQAALDSFGFETRVSGSFGSGFDIEWIGADANTSFDLLDVSNNTMLGGPDGDDAVVITPVGVVSGSPEGGTGDLTFSEDAYIQVPGVTVVHNTIDMLNNSPIQLADNQVAYVDISRDISSDDPQNLSVVVTDIKDDALFSNDAIIIARRHGSDVHVGSGLMRLDNGESAYLEATSSNDTLDFIGANTTADSTPNYNSTNVVDQGSSLTAAVSKLDEQVAFNSAASSQLQLSEKTSEILNISGSSISQGDDTWLEQEIESFIMEFDGMDINMTTGDVFDDEGVLLDNIEPIVNYIPVDGDYLWFSVGLIPSTVTPENKMTAEQLLVPASSTGSSEDSAPRANLVGTKKLGGVLIKRVGTSAEIISIERLGAGTGSGGEGGGIGNALEPLAPYLAVVADDFSNRPGTTDDLTNDSLTNAQYSLLEQSYTMLFEPGSVLAVNGLQVQLAAGPSTFALKTGDVIVQGDMVYTLTSDFDGTYCDVTHVEDLITGPCFVSQAIHTKNLPKESGDPAENTTPNDFYPDEYIENAKLRYYDSVIEDDSTPDYIDEPRVTAFLQPDVTDASAWYKYEREEYPEASIPIIFPDAEEGVYEPKDLSIIFVPKFDQAAVAAEGSANLMGYDVSFYPENGVDISGVLESAYGYTDPNFAQSRANIYVADWNGEDRTFINFEFGYTLNVRAGQASGQLFVVLNGQELPRYIDGVTLGSWYAEVDTRTIVLDKDYTQNDYDYQIELRNGVIDTSDENKNELNALMNSLKLSSDTELFAARYTRIMADTTGGQFTITFPVNPSVGDRIEVCDPVSSWGSASCLIDSNGHNIDSVLENDELNVDKGTILYEYYDSTVGFIRVGKEM